jgi:CSLREA domain-containing protein
MHHLVARRKNTRRPSALLTVVGLIGLLALPVGFLDPFRPAARAAATFAVNSTGDAADANVGDGLCDDGAGNCTLRAAIQEANQLDGSDTISFSVNGTITLTSALPTLSNLTITGPGPAQLTVSRDPDASTFFRIFTTAISSTVSISGLTVSGGRTGDDGGGIYSRSGTALTLSNVVVSGNATEHLSFGGARGGGIFNEGDSLSIVNSTVRDNSAASGTFISSTKAGRDGGGIYSSRGTLAITNSTISGNKAGDASDPFAQPGRGGGLFITSTDGATLTNTTVSGNRTGNNNSNANGGGIFKQGTGLTLTSCTVVNNTARSSGGGIIGGGIVLRNTIVADNIANSSPDLAGTYNSQDFNLIENTSGATFTGTTAHNVTGVNPLLGPLQNNEGPTQAHALLPGSPAVDAGDSGGLTTDQRGLARPFDDPSEANASDGADIGAYEAQAVTAAGQIQFSSATYSVTEGAATASITVTRTGGSAGAVSATFDTSDGTAAAGEDYTSVSAFTVNFADGDSAAKTVEVPITDDVLNEPDETVTLSLSNPTGGATFGSPAVATLTIADNNDPLPTLSINDIATPEGDTGTSSAQFTITLSPSSGFPVTVLHSTSPGTATSGDDYFPSGGDLVVFAPGETSKTISITVRGDRNVEPDETFFVNLSDPTKATISDAQGQGTIVEDDSTPPGLKFTATNYFESESTAPPVVTVTRTGDISGEAAVDYATSDGTASERSDYTAALGRLRFAAGEDSKTITVLVSDDRFDEANETINLTLSNPTGATLVEPSTTTITIQDNDAADGPSPVASGQNFDPVFFVNQHYHDFLNRPAEDGGRAFWTNEIESCGADTQCREARRENVSAAFFLSIEFQETGFLVQRMYKAAYGDAVGLATQNGQPIQIPVPVVRLEEFLPDTQEISRDVIVGTAGWPERLDANKTAFTRAFVSRARFTTAYPAGMTPEQFVDALNENSGDVLSDSERAALVAELSGNNTTAGRASVLRKVAEDSDLASAERNRAFVLMQFFGYLRRNPNDLPDTNYGGYNFWLGKLNEFDGNFVHAQMVRAFIDSAEYKQRFGL